MTPGYAKTRSQLPHLYYPKADTMRVINAHRGGGGGGVGFGDELFLLRGPTGVTDQSESGNNGSYLGGMGVTTDTDSGGVSAFVFDGSDDGIICDSAAGVGNGNYTLAAWVKSSVSAGTQVIASQRVSGKYPFLLGVQPSATAEGYAILAFDGSTAFKAVSSVNPSGTTWDLVVGTFDGSILRIYVNGSLEGTGSTSGKSDWSNTDQLTIGWREQTGSNLRLTGRLDDVRVLSRAITTGDVSAWYSAGRGYDA